MDWCALAPAAYREALKATGRGIEIEPGAAKAMRKAAKASGRSDVDCLVERGLFTDGRETVLAVPPDLAVMLAFHDFALAAGHRAAKFAKRLERLIPASATPRRFKVIYLDPPWRYASFGNKGHGRARDHYKTLSIEKLAELKIDLGWGPRSPLELADPDGCVMLMWITDPKAEDGLGLMRSWGFPAVTKAFVWIKVKQKAGKVVCVREADMRMGLGRYTRSVSEDCWLGRKGSVPVKRKDILRVVLGTVGRHSAKPQAIYERIESLWPGPYLELFSRSKRPGWVSWGNDPATRKALYTKAPRRNEE